LKKYEVIKALTFISGAYPGRFSFPTGNEEIDSITVQAWTELLKDFPSNLVFTAVKTLCANSKWPPSTHDVLEHIRNISSNHKTPAEAWEEFKYIASIYGVYRQKEALDKLPELTTRTINAMGGFTKVATYNDTNNFLEKRFLDLYEQLANSQKDHERLPKSTRKDVEKLSDHFKGTRSLDKPPDNALE